ncbi:hypothetical protein LTR86_005194 [Recurvomyces mirabilis]|nr:hypothetical protein LTR86_005194 [Recurvomyces mirabilis]
MARKVSMSDNRWLGVLMDVSCAAVSVQIRLGKDTLLARAYDAMNDRRGERMVARPILDELQTIRQWLAKCEGHDCAAKVTFAGRPSRLLRLSRDSVTLVQTPAVTPTPRYVTLSYCWGAIKRRKKLTFESKAEFERGVEYSSLPRTISEAARLVYNLGIPYIWVDSLCIIQGSDEWKYEAKRMHEVYGHAVFTLAPTSAEHNDDTMEFIRPGSEVAVQGPTRVKFAQLIAFAGPVDVPSSSIRTVLEQSSLADRGWIFQEEILSPRMVYWSDEGLIWSCLQHKDTAGSVTLGEGDLKQLPLQYQGFWAQTDPQRMWPDMIANYSKRSFTDPSDRLKALEGVAATVHELGNDKYLSGNWRREFPHFLSWTAERDHERGEKPTPSKALAPSWSWASVPPPRPIRMDDHKQQGTAIFHNVIGAGEDTLIMTGRLTILTSNLKEIDWPRQVVVRPNGSVECPAFTHGRCVFAIEPQPGRRYVLVSRQGKKCSRGTFDFSDVSDDDVCRLHCFEITASAFLLLLPTSTAMAQRSFRRVGCVQRCEEPGFFVDAEAVQIALS